MSSWQVREGLITVVQQKVNNLMTCLAHTKDNDSILVSNNMTLPTMIV